MKITRTTVTTVLKVSVAVAAAAAFMPLAGSVLLSAQGSSCGLQKNEAPLAFCETFDQPFPATSRSGQLDGTLWGVSRLTGLNDFQGLANAWSPSTLVACEGSQPARPDATDVIVCNGRMRQSTDDNGSVTTLAIYPKQPFDFANRTGTVAFDVTNDTTATHGVWPEFWMSDQPVPAPFTHGGTATAQCDMCSVPRNGFGIRFGGVFEPFQGPQAPNCPADNHRRWIVESYVVARNYIPSETSWINNPNQKTLGCVIASSGPNGTLNHIELRISQQQIEVWATDAGSTKLKLISRLENANLSFTRGLIWLADSHYNAHKSAFPESKVHTFTWDNVAFDGPAPYRDLSYDVLDRLTTNSDGTLNLGWNTTPSSPANLTTLPMSADGIARATSALLLFNYGNANVSTFNFTINGHANTVTSPVPTALTGWKSVALPVPLDQLRAGPASLLLSADRDVVVTNVNIVLIAGAPVPALSGTSRQSTLQVAP
jgi:hypothetical protein